MRSALFFFFLLMAFGGGVLYLVRTVMVQEGQETVSIAFESHKHNFFVRFPSTPSYERDEVLSNDELVATYDSYVAEDGDGDDFSVILLRYPHRPRQEPPQELSQRLINEILNETTGNELVSLFDTEVGRLPAVDFVIQNGSGYRRYRLVIGTRAQFLLCVSSDEVFSKRERIDGFFDSFRILDMRYF